MNRAILLAVALSWDSLIVGAVDGSFSVSGASKLRMAMLFALFDGAAAAVGLSFGGQALLWERFYDAMGFAPWIILVLLVAGRIAGKAFRVSYLLPFLFCIDNFAAGSALAGSGAAPAVTCALAGLISGLFFLAGSSCGHCAATKLNRLPRRAVGGSPAANTSIFRQTQSSDLANCNRGCMQL